MRLSTDLAYVTASPVSYDENKLFVRQSPSHPWLPLYDYAAELDEGVTPNPIRVDNLSQVLSGAGQQLGSASQFRFGYRGLGQLELDSVRFFLNSAPTWSREDIRVTLPEDTEFHEIDLSKFFSDPEGDALTYSIGKVTNGDSLVAKIEGDKLIITKVNLRVTRMEVFATDIFGDSAKTEASLLVYGVVRLNEPIEDIRLKEGVTRYNISTRDLFVVNLSNPRLSYEVEDTSFANFEEFPQGLSVEIKSTGTTKITVTGEDTFGNTLKDDFMFAVYENSPPEVLQILSDTIFQVGYVQARYAIPVELFSDPDGEEVDFGYEVDDSEHFELFLDDLGIEGRNFLLTELFQEVPFDTVKATLQIFGTDRVDTTWTSFKIFIIGELGGLSVDKSSIQENFIYPNPSFGSINVKLPGVTSVSSFKLIDLSGRSQEIDVRRVDADNYLVEFKKARKGIYYLEIHSENSPVVRKRIINY